MSDEYVDPEETVTEVPAAPEETVTETPAAPAPEETVTEVVEEKLVAGVQYTEKEVAVFLDRLLDEFHPEFPLFKSFFAKYL